LHDSESTSGSADRPGGDRFLLRISDVFTGYGKKEVLSGVSLDVAPGEIVAVIGHNGAGKSTLLKVLFGLLPIWRGQISLDGNILESVSPRRMLHEGMSLIPQGNRVFGDLTVRENLEVAGTTLSDKTRSDQGFQYALLAFPALRARLSQRAGTLSGGEKQMLALANAIIISPRLLLLDEPSLGLAPPLVVSALERIREISRSSGATVLIVEQKVREVLKVAHRVYVLRTGRVTFEGLPAALDDDKLRQVYF